MRINIYIDASGDSVGYEGCCFRVRDTSTSGLISLRLSLWTFFAVIYGRVRISGKAEICHLRPQKTQSTAIAYRVRGPILGETLAPEQKYSEAPCCAVKEDGLIRELSSNSEPTFYPCTVFRQPRPLPEGALMCR